MPASISPEREREVIILNSLITLAKESLQCAATTAHRRGLSKIEVQLRAAFDSIQHITKEEIRNQLIQRLNQGELFKDDGTQQT